MKTKSIVHTKKDITDSIRKDYRRESPLPLLNKRRVRNLVIIIFILFSIIPAGCAVNNKVLMGRDASSYLADLKERFVRKPYTAKYIRWRGSERVIALIFNTNGGGFESISRLDDGLHFYSYLILDRIEETTRGVTEEDVQSYLKEIEKNHLKPFVIFDKSGEEKAIIWTRVGNQISAYVNGKGHVTIELSDNLYMGRRAISLWRRNQNLN
jgi:hypothetical protein